MSETGNPELPLEQFALVAGSSRWWPGVVEIRGDDDLGERSGEDAF
jgi:hypothetical protein